MYYQATWQKIENNYTRRMSTLGDRINLYCILTGVNKRQISLACSAYGRAHHVDFCTSLIYRYAKNKCQPKMDKLTVMSKVMGVSTTWLLGYGTNKLSNYKHI